MKFLLDQNADRRLVAYLRTLGHDVIIISKDYPHGLPDKEILTIAFNEKRILITYDKGDFGELIFRQHCPHNGVILFRLLTQEDVLIENQTQRISYVLTEYKGQLHHFIVITSNRVKIRREI